MKNLKYNYSLLGSLGLLIILLTISCTRNEDDFAPATFPTTAEVFIDGFSGGLEYQAFDNSKLTAFDVVSDVSFSGQFSMRFEIPNEGDPLGSYAGGILTDIGGRDLSGYNALTFWVKGSQAATIDQIGFGTDFIDDKYVVTLNNIDLSTAWTKHIIPIPDPSKLTQEKGLLLFSDGPDDGKGYTLWIDEVKFEKLDNLTQPRAKILNGADLTEQTFLGVSRTIGGLTYTVNLPNGRDQTVVPAPAFYSFSSSDTTVAKVDVLGKVSILNTGNTIVTATLGSLTAIGSLTLESLGDFTAAPVPPSRDPGDVISIFSDAYTNIAVDYYNGYWGGSTTQGQNDININGNEIIKYTSLNYVGIQFAADVPTVDASQMTHLHVDIQVEDQLEPGDFIRIELADFGPDGEFNTGDESGGSFTLSSSDLATGIWKSFDIPFSNFPTLTSRAFLAQVVFVSDATISNILVDNIYFYKDDGSGGGGGMCTAETAQSLDATDFNLSFQADPGTSVGSFDALLTTVDNPDFDNSVNSSCKVGQIDRNGSALFANNQIDFDTKFDFNTNAGFKMKVWSPNAGTNVLVKLEDKANSGINVEVGAATSAAGAWEELTFDFGSGESGKYDKIILFFELNTNTTETYFIDDFALYGGGGGGAVCTPETSQSLAATDFELTFQSDPGASVGSFDAVLTTVTNPDFDNAVNSSCQVGQIDRNGSALFANNQIDFDTKLDFNTNAGFKMKVWSPNAGTNVLVKLEDKANSGINVEVGAATSTAGAWEELTFDFGSGESGKYDKIILFFELNTNTTETYYIDDFALYGGGGGGAVCTPETSQSLAATDFELTFQSDPGASVGSFDAVLTTVANPDFDNAVNSSCQVGQIDRNGGALFANNQIDFDTKFDFNTNAGFKMKVWSPTAGTNVLVKLEDKANSGINVEVGATTSTAGAWEELTFDFGSGESGKYDKIILFFELNTNTTETYYIDDFALYGSGGGGGSAATFPLDFEDGLLFFNAFEGATTAVIDNPQTSGNSSSKVLELVKPNGVRFFAGINSDQMLNGPMIDLADGLVFTVKVWSPKAGISVRMRLEQEPGVTNPPAYEIFQTVANANEWTTLTFDFSTTPAMSSFSYTRLVLNTDWGTDPAGGETYYIDDIEQGNAAAVCDPETSQSLDAADFDLTFQTDPGAAVGSFDAVLTTVANPDFDNAVNSSCQVGQIVRNGGALFANNQIDFDAKFDFNANAGFKLKVWSPSAGTNVLVKLEDKTNNAINVEVGATTTAAGAWEELTFDFGSGESDKYDKIILFFELNTNTSETYYIDDFALYSSGGGGGGSNFINNSGFETGDDTGWLFFNNGGTTAVISDASNGSSFTAKITSGPTNNPGIKQERFGVGTIQPNQEIEVTLDSKVEALMDGAIINVLAFSESATMGVGAQLHNLGSVNTTIGSWNANTFTFTTGADVTGGLSLLVEVVCGGAATCSGVAYFDNVSLTIK